MVVVVVLLLFETVPDVDVLLNPYETLEFVRLAFPPVETVVELLPEFRLLPVEYVVVVVVVSD